MYKNRKRSLFSRNSNGIVKLDNSNVSFEIIRRRILRCMKADRRIRRRRRRGRRRRRERRRRRRKGWKRRRNGRSVVLRRSQTRFLLRCIDQRRHRPVLFLARWRAFSRSRRIDDIELESTNSDRRLRIHQRRWRRRRSPCQEFSRAHDRSDASERKSKDENEDDDFFIEIWSTLIEITANLSIHKFKSIYNSDLIDIAGDKDLFLANIRARRKLTDPSGRLASS